MVVLEVMLAADGFSMQPHSRRTRPLNLFCYFHPVAQRDIDTCFSPVKGPDNGTNMLYE